MFSTGRGHLGRLPNAVVDAFQVAADEELEVVEAGLALVHVPVEDGLPEVEVVVRPVRHVIDGRLEAPVDLHHDWWWRLETSNNQEIRRLKEPTDLPRLGGDPGGGR